MTVMFRVTDPIWKSWAKIQLREPKPCIWSMLGLDTEPVTSLVTPRLAPWRTKNVPNVIRKLGMPVLMTR